MPRVSVIIPCYNDGLYLREAVTSALEQDFKDLDVIIVDDGSTDQGTLEELNLLSQWSRVTLMRQPNSGPSAARNKGIDACSSDYFMPLDADDVIEPQYVGQGVKVLDAHDAVGAVYCRANLFGDANEAWRLPEFDWATILVHNLVFNACLFRRADWASVGGYDESMRAGREDHDFILRILGLGRSVWRLEGVYFHYRQRHGSRNATIGESREQLIASSAKIFRNNISLYGGRAEDLFEFIYRQHDEIADLRHRYAAFEAIRTRLPWLFALLKHLVKALRFLFAASVRVRARASRPFPRVDL